ncbi:MAG: hypothetical protein CVV18_00010 [Gammaproteobacteria bacterium HGW-Gammaproteobacteria-8]|nr:MAG: hypothetical protein CVV18_00010 [Gammaproteobacteria bacterium HGW-Gammaproteobacteria-8]
MDAERWARLQTLFDEGADLAPEAQVEWLKGIADSDPELVEELRRWLLADRDSDVLPLKIERYASTAAGVLRLEPGDQVGPYTVEDLLGVGGMGAVYRAHRSDASYRQQVVIKVVDAAPDAELARLFERERQILADLAHPNIARLLDGGKLASGHPYLVMEFVDGDDIASYCDRIGAGLEQRLDLFIEVCHAVQFAHSNLVVHRDIKPDNVMVDRDGNVRLLDFGIATLLDAETGPTPTAAGPAPLNETRTLKGAMLSPAYASPEQHCRQPVTTASDIYSLGVLLYRLLTGAVPAHGALVPPSTALAASGDSRGARRLQGDLDAIVQCAMRDDPEQRYPTVNAMIRDLRRFLQQRTVEAHSSGWFHKARLFARRSRGLALSLVAIVILVLGFSLVMTWLAVKLEAERTRALASAEATDRVAEFMVELFAAADPEQHLGATISARELLDRGQERIRAQLVEQPAVKAQLLHRMAQAYRNLGLDAQAEPLYLAALGLSVDLPEPQRLRIELEHADLVREIGRSAEAIERLESLIARIESSSRADADPALLAKAYNDYGLALANDERFEESLHWAEQALAVKLPANEQSALSQVRFRHNLALALSRLGRQDESIALLEAVIEEKRVLMGERHPSLLLSLEVLAGRYRLEGELEQAAAIFEQARLQRLELYGPDSPQLASLDNELANVHHDAGRYRDAERAYMRALDYYRAHPQVEPLTHAYTVNNLASLYEDSGDLARAEPLFRESLQLRIALNGETDLSVLRVRINLARLLISAGALDEADVELDRVDALLHEHYPDNRLRAAHSARQRARLASARGHHETAGSLMKAALAEIEAVETGTSPALIGSRLDAAHIALAAGEPEPAARLLEQVDAVLAESFAEDHPQRLAFRVLQLELDRARGGQVGAEEYAELEQALLARLHPDSNVLRRLRALAPLAVLEP